MEATKKDYQKKISKLMKWKGNIYILTAILLIIGIFYIYVLDFADIRQPSIDRECCENVCSNMFWNCHRYTRDYIICKTDDIGGMQRTKMYYVNDTKRVCEFAKTVSDATR